MQKGKHVYIRNVKPENIFVLVNGEKAANIYDLGRLIKGLSDDHYSHHVNTEKNDFANWIHECVGDKFLAHKLRGARNKNHTAHMINTRVRQLQEFPDDEATYEMLLNKSQREAQGNTVEHEDLIQDLELLQGLNTESFFEAYYSGEHTTKDDGSDEFIKESDASLRVLKKTDLPRMSMQTKFDSKPFMAKLDTLFSHIDKADIEGAKKLYLELRDEFQQTNFPDAYKKSIHSMLSECHKRIATIH